MKAMGKDVKMLAMFDTYAEQTQKYDSKLKKTINKIWLTIKQIAYTPVLMMQDPKRAIEYKLRELGKRIAKIGEKAKPAEKKHGYSAYSNQIHERSLAAQRNYELVPLDIAIELFRAQKKTFYMDDFKYLGWIPYALKGVRVHEIPGEHNTIFAPPNDIQFGKVLQACLDKAAK
jgi:thioesterase domain-containing protein